VSDAHRALGLVDVLAAGSARPVDIDAQLALRDVEIDFVLHVRRDGHGRERGLPARILIERRDPDQPVDAGLGLEQAVGIGALDHQGRALDARLLGRLLVQQIHLPALAQGVARDHADQHLGPVGRVHSAGTRVDLDHRVARVVLAREHAVELELVERLSDLVAELTRLARGGRVPRLLGQVEQHDRVGQLAVEAVERLDHRLGQLGLLQDRLRLGRALPEVRHRRQRLQLGDPLALAAYVKDAPEARPACRRARRGETGCP
jgi:hypothetical protein